MILRLNGRQGQGQGKRSLEARADAFSHLKNSSGKLNSGLNNLITTVRFHKVIYFFLRSNLISKTNATSLWNSGFITTYSLLISDFPGEIWFIWFFFLLLLQFTVLPRFHEPRWKAGSRLRSWRLDFCRWYQLRKCKALRFAEFWQRSFFILQVS